MNTMLEVPQDRRKTKAGRVCLLLGMTLLLFLMIAYRFGETAGLMGAAAAG